MKHKYQFFISSTFKDLTEERKIAIDAIMKLGHIPAGMESFTSTGKDQFESIKPYIDDSDYYIIILGGKYGTIIKNEKISYTEKEYDYAMSNNKSIIAFVYDDPENLPSSKRETKQSMINYFNKFRSKILNNGMASLWHDQLNLSRDIAASIANVVENYPADTCWKHVKRNFSETIEYDDTIFGKTEYINVYSKEQCAPYYRGIPVTLFEFQTDETNYSLKMQADFTMLKKDYSNYRWAGIYIRSLPCRNWKKYILNGSLIKFSAVATPNVKSMWFEIKSDRVEMCKRRIEFENGILNEYSIDLSQFNATINDWEFVREICLVLYPEYIEDDISEITIYNLRIES